MSFLKTLFYFFNKWKKIDYTPVSKKNFTLHSDFSRWVQLNYSCDKLYNNYKTCKTLVKCTQTIVKNNNQVYFVSYRMKYDQAWLFYFQKNFFLHVTYNY